jgi:hypothetical protein
MMSNPLCGAKTRAGGKCRKPAMDGTVRCVKYGGALPQVQRKVARERVMRDAYRAQDRY